MSNIIDFGAGILPIYLDYKNAQLYHHCKSYDPSVLAQPGNWHLIKINHKGLFKDSKNEYNLIIDALFDAVENEEFYPVAYRKSIEIDSFLVRNCQAAIDKLFSRNLQIHVEYGSPPMDLAIYFNIATYKFGQISPQNLMSRVLFNLFDNLVHYNGIDDLLNLNYFSEQVEFTHTIIYLGNTGVLGKLCELIINNNDKFRDINGIMLVGNNICSVAPLKILDCSSFKLIDLSKNSISSTKRFCREIKEVCVHEILLAGNPLVKSNKYPKCLIDKGLGKNFKYVDGIAFDSLLNTYTQTSIQMDLNKNGKLINETNVSDIRSYEQSDNWHAIIIPDPEGNLSKESVIDYFFLLISPDLCEFYPCYYKYDNIQHSFLVRQCFDQLMYIAETSNFKLLIPHMVEGTNGDAAGQCIFNNDVGLPFHMRMDVSRFLASQVDPRRDLQKAIAKRYNVINRVLDLNNLQSSDLLDNVIVKMSSCKILMTVLNIAGRMFLDNCTELRLSENKILNIGKLTSLGYFTKLLAIDLSNNWISSLHDISELSVVPFKVMILDGNPLCKQYEVPSEYIKAVKDIFPHLNKLDNVDIQKNPSLVWHKNFLITPLGYEFAEQFVRTYFPMYEEASKRFDMVNVYASDAMFSITCRYWSPRMKPDVCLSVSKYTKISRNIARNSTSLGGYYIGNTDIVPLLCSLPNVKHDYQSFTIDMPHYDLKHDGKNGGSCAIYVSGLFKESKTALEEGILYAFNRRFVIKFGEKKEGLCGDGRRYEIVNEHFSLTSPTENQKMTAFKYADAAPVLITSDSIKATPQDHETLLVLFKETTGLNAVWCNRCLEGSNWNYQAALKNFIKMTQAQQIPKNAWDFK